MTQFKSLFFCILISLIGLFSFGVNAQQDGANDQQNGVNTHQNRISIYVITRFDYPGTGNSTTPFGINERGDIVGDYVDSNNVRRGFRRRIGGSFVRIVEPNDAGNFTRARGINNSGTIVGDFFNLSSGFPFHGYLLNGNRFTQVDVIGPFSTGIFGINDHGDIVGAFGSNAQPNRPFLKVNGVTTTVSIPGAVDGQGIDINNNRQMVGSYRDSSLVEHGFIRTANGTLTNPVDFPGAATTIFNGLNNRGWIVGSYTDTLGHQHGLFRKNTNTYVSFDYPNSAGTSLNGINDFGFIAGRYTDSAGIRHGFVAWVSAFGSDDEEEES